MCNPVAAIVGLAVGAGQAALQGSAQASAARDQNRYRARTAKAQQKAYEETLASVKSDVGLQVETLYAQRIQQIDAQRQELQNITRDSRLASAGYRAGTAEAGIMGKTVDQVHSQFERDVLEFESAASRNITNMTVQVNREAQAIYSRGQSIINQGYPSPLPPPANVNMGLIGMQGLLTGISVGTSLHGAFGSPGGGGGGGGGGGAGGGTTGGGGGGWTSGGGKGPGY